MAGFFVRGIAVLTVALLGSFSPGFLFVRRLRLSPLEKLGVSVGASIVVVYLFQFLLFLTGAPLWTTYFVTTAFALAAAIAASDARRLLRSRRVRAALALFGAMLAWALLLVCMVRHFGGGDWTGDWHEHYERSLFFLRRIPADYAFEGMYLLPARPPLENVVAAFYLSQFGESFAVYQVVFAVLNLFPVLWCFLIAPSLMKGRRPDWRVLAAILATSPMLAENVTYTWTKALAAGYVILALHLYLAAWRKDDSLRMILASLSLSAGCLVHYSAVPSALFIGVHYLVVSLGRSRLRWRELLPLAFANSLLVGTWAAYSLAVYGPKMTLGSNTTAAGFASITLTQKVAVMGANVLNTLVPFPLRNLASPLPDQNRWGEIRDYAFFCYQANLPLMLGSVGWLAAAYLFAWAWRHRNPRNGMESRFWLAFILVTVPFGVATVPPPADPFGDGHVTGLPIVLLGLTLLSMGFSTLPTLMAGALVVSRAVDFALGILLQFVLEGVAFVMAVSKDGKPYIILREASDRLSRFAMDCWGYKTNLHLRFVGDELAPLATPLRVTCGLVGIAAVTVLAMAYAKSAAATPAHRPRLGPSS